MKKQGYFWCVLFLHILVSLFAWGTVSAETTRVSVDSSGVEGWGSSSYLPFISSDGRYVAFFSYASNLVAGDTNENWDVFFHDRQTGTTTRVSVDSSGTQGNGPSWESSISSDGRYVAFDSGASNLVAGDTNMNWDVFVHDRQTGATSRVSVDSNGVQGDDESGYPAISSDGRYVVFYSDAGNLVAGDSNGCRDVFVHDRQTGATTRVSVDSNGVQGDGDSDDESISFDGRYVAFHSASTNLVAGDTNGYRDVFVHDCQTGATTRVSVDSNGVQGDHNSDSVSISSDGRYVAFHSGAGNLVAGDSGYWDVFVHDCQTRTTTRVSLDSNGVPGNDYSKYPSISFDGRYVAFHSVATNLVAGDTNEARDVFVHDCQTGVTTRVSVDSNGVQGDGNSDSASISSDGCCVAFRSVATNLVATDTNGDGDIFVYDRLPQGNLYFPHIASNSMWETEIAIVNPSAAATVTGTLRPFGDSGAAVSTTVPVTLAPHGRRQLTISQRFTNPDTIGYMRFESDSSAVKGYTKFYRQGLFRAAIPAAGKLNSGEIYLTHVNSDPNWWTGVSVLNTSAQAKNLNFEFNNGTTISRSIAANEHQRFLLSQLFSPVAIPGGIESGVLKNASGVIGLELFSSANQMEGIPITDDTATTLYYPHVPSDSTWWTGFVTYNPSGSTCALTISPYRADGTVLTPITRSLASKEKLSVVASGLGLPADTGWVEINATSAITGFALIGTADWNQVGGFYGIGAKKKEGVFAKVEENGGWSYLTLVNTEDSTASVTLTAYDDSGTQVASTTFTLNAHGKTENKAQGFFPNQSISMATYLAYSSDKDLVGLQLNRSADQAMLDGLPGL